MKPTKRSIDLIKSTTNDLVMKNFSLLKREYFDLIKTYTPSVQEILLKSYYLALYQEYTSFLGRISCMVCNIYRTKSAEELEDFLEKEFIKKYEKLQSKLDLTPVNNATITKEVSEASFELKNFIKESLFSNYERITGELIKFLQKSPAHENIYYDALFEEYLNIAVELFSSLNDTSLYNTAKQFIRSGFEEWTLVIKAKCPESLKYQSIFDLENNLN